MISQYPVLPSHRNYIGSDRCSNKIEKFKNIVICQTELWGQRGDQFKTYTATAKFFIRVVAIFLFGIKNGNSRRQYLIGKVMITNNKIYTECFCVSNEIGRFDTAVQRNDQCKTTFFRIINSCFTYTVSFPVTMGYIEIKVIVYFF